MKAGAVKGKETKETAIACTGRRTLAVTRRGEEGLRRCSPRGDQREEEGNRQGRSFRRISFPFVEPGVCPPARRVLGTPALY